MMNNVANRTDLGATIGLGNRVTVLDGWTLTYDDAGFLTSRVKGAESLTYTWNALGQLTQVQSSLPYATTTYGYDGLGRRVWKTANGVTTRYLVEGDRVLIELDDAWAPAAEYSYYPGTDRPQAMKRGGVVYYFAQDIQGNVTGLISATGAVASTYEYTPYGEEVSATGSVANPYRYKGREWDAEARLYFMRARYYDPQLGRFLSEDPIGLAGGINPMAFVGGDPVNSSDPSGLCRRYAATYYDRVYDPRASLDRNGKRTRVTITGGYLWLGCAPLNSTRSTNQATFDRPPEDKDPTPDDWFKLPGRPGLLENPYLDSAAIFPRIEIDLPANACDVYSGTSGASVWSVLHYLGPICNRVTAGNMNVKTAQCLAYQWVELEYVLGRLPASSEARNYLVNGHSACYDATGYRISGFIGDFIRGP